MIIDILYSLVYIIPLTLISKSAVFSNMVNFDELETPHLPLIIMLFASLLFALVINVDNRKKITISGSVLALLFGGILVTGKEVRREWFAGNLWIWPAVLIFVGVVITFLLIQRFRNIKRAVGLLVAALLISSFWTNIIDDTLGLMACVFLIFIVLMEEIRFRERKGELLQKYVVCIAPFLLIGGIILGFLPSRTEPYDWSFTKKTITRIVDSITSLMQSFDEGDSANDMESTFGFSENAGVGGNVDGEPAEEMAVLTGRDNAAYIYLDGKYFEDFDGRKWHEAECSYPYMMDTLELSCALSRIDSLILKDYRKIPEVDITYKGLNTVYTFAPLKSILPDGIVSDMPVSYSDNEILFSKKSGHNTKYRIKYIAVNSNEETLPEILENGKNIDREQWDFIRGKQNLTGDEYSYDAFLAYRDKLYNMSLCPNVLKREQLSDGVEEFLEEALSESETDYEKLCALEEAFSRFTYTTNPGALPSYVDTPSAFLDYFVLDSRQGYCNSFATAFVLLAQSEGIPARFVHGYRVPRSNQVTSVMNTMAHAYAEAYVEGIGWTVFDPTPGYIGRVRWDAQGRYVADENQGYRYGGEYYEDDETLTDTSNENDKGVIIKWYMIVIPISLGLLVFMIIILTQRAINLRNLRNMNIWELRKYYCDNIIKLLTLYGFKKESFETINEYVIRVGDTTGYRLEKFKEIYEKVLYSNRNQNDLFLEQERESDDSVLNLMTEYSALTSKLSGVDRLYYQFLKFMGKM